MYTEEVTRTAQGLGVGHINDKSAALRRNCFREGEEGVAKKRAGGDSRKTQEQKMKSESGIGRPQKYLKRLTS